MLLFIMWIPAKSWSGRSKAIEDVHTCSVRIFTVILGWLLTNDFIFFPFFAQSWIWSRKLSRVRGLWAWLLLGWVTNDFKVSQREENHSLKMILLCLYELICYNIYFNITTWQHYSCTLGGISESIVLRLLQGISWPFKALLPNQPNQEKLV